MKLYYSPGACSLAAHIVLHEADLSHTPVLASTKTHQLNDGTDFYSINPLGYLPVLELTNGKRLREVPAILQYLADLVPAKQLAPSNGTFERYQLQEWLGFIGTELHKSFGPLFKPNTFEECRVSAREHIVSRLQWVNNELLSTHYLMGDTYTVADAYLFTVTNWCRIQNLDITKFTGLTEYRERVAKRPTVQAAMKAEGIFRE